MSKQHKQMPAIVISLLLAVCLVSSLIAIYVVFRSPPDPKEVTADNFKFRNYTASAESRVLIEAALLTILNGASKKEVEVFLQNSAGAVLKSSEGTRQAYQHSASLFALLPGKCRGVWTIIADYDPIGTKLERVQVWGPC